MEMQVILYDVIRSISYFSLKINNNYLYLSSTISHDKEHYTVYAKNFVGRKYASSWVGMNKFKSPWHYSKYTVKIKL